MDECDGLENRYARKGIKGSNPFPSAKFSYENPGSLVLVDVLQSAKDWV